MASQQVRNATEPSQESLVRFYEKFSQKVALARQAMSELNNEPSSGRASAILSSRLEDVVNCFSYDDNPFSEGQLPRRMPPHLEEILEYVTDHSDLRTSPLIVTSVADAERRNYISTLEDLEEICNYYDESLARYLEQQEIKKPRAESVEIERVLPVNGIAGINLQDAQSLYRDLPEVIQILEGLDEKIFPADVLKLLKRIASDTETAQRLKLDLLQGALDLAQRSLAFDIQKAKGEAELRSLDRARSYEEEIDRHLHHAAILKAKETEYRQKVATRSATGAFNNRYIAAAAAAAVGLVGFVTLRQINSNQVDAASAKTPDPAVVAEQIQKKNGIPAAYGEGIAKKHLEQAGGIHQIVQPDGTFKTNLDEIINAANNEIQQIAGNMGSEEGSSAAVLYLLKADAAFYQAHNQSVANHEEAIRQYEAVVRQLQDDYQNTTVVRCFDGLITKNIKFGAKQNIPLPIGSDCPEPSVETGFAVLGR